MGLKKSLIALSLVLAPLYAVADEGDEIRGGDWRTRASTTDKVENLVKTIPGAADIMIVVGERYQNLYWAAKQGKWEFAEYQAEELKDLIEKLQITRPKRAKTAQEFLDAVFPDIIQASGSGDWKRFSSSFERMRERCMQCHVKNDHGFIVLEIPKTASSPVLNMKQ